MCVCIDVCVCEQKRKKTIKCQIYKNIQNDKKMAYNKLVKLMKLKKNVQNKNFEG